MNITAANPSAPKDFQYAILDWRGTSLTRAFLRASLPRPEVDVTAAVETVRPIIDAVRARGAEAASEYSRRFDGVAPSKVRVPVDALSAALEGLDGDVRSALETSIERVRAVAQFSMPSDSRVEVIDGGVVEERCIPVQRVGLYIPGGRAVLPSSVVMNAVPAQVAGVPSIAVASPPNADNEGLPHPTILAACALLGLDEVYAVGGAQAVGLFAYGDEEPADGSEVIQPVDLVTGPGNVFVAAAKRAVQGTVGIDSEAGPTEIAIIADGSADPALVASDLISQAEHDPMAASVLITPSEKLVELVGEELHRQVPRTRHAERVREALGGRQSGAVLVDSIDDAIVVANEYGAEHLEIHTDAAETSSARDVSTRITNAGAIFVGGFSPVSLGDYAAGSNHVLPTGGSSRFSSGLGVHSFMRRVHAVEYSREALEASRFAAETLAAAEGLPAHGEAVAVRFGDR